MVVVVLTKFQDVSKLKNPARDGSKRSNMNQRFQRRKDKNCKSYYLNSKKKFLILSLRKRILISSMLDFKKESLISNITSCSHLLFQLLLKTRKKKNWLLSKTNLLNLQANNLHKSRVSQLKCATNPQNQSRSSNLLLMR